MNHRRLLEMLLNDSQLTQQKAFAFYDTLDAVSEDFMYGKWRGKELSTGHPMDGLLKATKWYGKCFTDAETVHPLMFQKRNGEHYYINPGWLPMHASLDKIPRSMVHVVFPFVSIFMRTKTSKARLRMLEYRGKISAAMIYDQHAICDIFRKVDADTVVGVMDLKGLPGQGYFFVLERQRTL